MWLGATVAATSLVWTATSVVASDVTDRPAPVVAHRDVVQALAHDVAAATPIAPPRAPASTVAPRPGPTAPVPVRTQPTAPGPGATPPTTTTTTTAPPGTATTAPTTQRPVDPTATFSSPGGVVTAACAGFFIRLVAATPADGYAVDVLDRGPATVDVHFVRPGGDVRLRLVCFNGQAIQIPDQFGTPTTAPPVTTTAPAPTRSTF